VHFRRLVEAGLASADAAVSLARGGLESVHRQMRVVPEGGEETGLGTLLSAPAQRPVAAVTVPGAGEAESELSLPYHGERLRGGDLLRRLDRWAEGGVIEPSCADAVRTVAAHPQWLRLPGRVVAVLGAGAEVGPLPALLSWARRSPWLHRNQEITHPGHPHSASSGQAKWPRSAGASGMRFGGSVSLSVRHKAGMLGPPCMLAMPCLIWCSGANDGGLVREDDSLGPVTQAEFREDPGDMRLDGGIGKHEPLGDLGV
jgi:hypothetical protein